MGEVAVEVDENKSHETIKGGREDIGLNRIKPGIFGKPEAKVHLRQAWSIEFLYKDIREYYASPPQDTPAHPGTWGRTLFGPWDLGLWHFLSWDLGPDPFLSLGTGTRRPYYCKSL